ncbi:hypothetical protein CKF59_05460, partial [Psittacicella gerlachiana]
MLTGDSKFDTFHKENVKNQEYKFTDISFTDLPLELQNQRIDSRYITITFTTTEKLKEFLDVYIYMFNDINGKPLDLGFLDMRHITNINFLFASQFYINHILSLTSSPSNKSNFHEKVHLNIDFSTLDLSNVYFMEATFAGTILHSDVSQLNVSKVRSMCALFYDAEFVCKQIDLGRWDVSRVCHMNLMFKGTVFNHQLNLNRWNVSNVTNMHLMFAGCLSIKEDLNHWDVSNVNNMAMMFMGAVEFNGDISNWNVSKVTNMSGMFYLTAEFNRDLSKWNVCRVSDYSEMFTSALGFFELYSPKFVKDVFIDPVYDTLPDNFKGRKIKQGELILKFTNLHSLKVFLDEYIERFDNIFAAPLDLSFIDM